MAEEIPVRCEECGFIIGHLVKTAHGGPVMVESGNNSNCKHPPIGKCESANAAWSKARAATRQVGS
jgi:hypothetical protein